MQKKNEEVIGPLKADQQKAEVASSSGSERFIDEHIPKILNVIKQVHEIYRTPKKGELKPYIACPWCGKETRNYNCAWGYNDHVHFSCEHCGNAFMQ